MRYHCVLAFGGLVASSILIISVSTLTLEARLEKLKELVAGLQSEGTRPDAPSNMPALEGYRCSANGPVELNLKGKTFVTVCDANQPPGFLIQKRINGEVDFYRSWKYYVKGFGNFRGNFWFGLDNIRTILSTGRFRIEFTGFDRYKDWKRNTFDDIVLAGPEDDYRILGRGGALMDAGNTSMITGMPFSTKERDHDPVNDVNCARYRKGAWWYDYNCKDDSKLTNPNGKVLQAQNGSMTWDGNDMKVLKIKLIPFDH